MRYARTILLLIFSVIASTLHAASHSKIDAALNLTALPPGQQAVIAVVVDIHSGYHAQSHTPTDPNFIKFEITPKQSDQVNVFEPIYPDGKVELFPALGTLSIYDNRVIVYVPIQVKPNAPPGPITLEGTARYQICDDKVCYPPEHPTWSVKTEIVPAGTAVSPANTELFQNFNPQVFSKILQPAVKPQVTTPTSGDVSIDFWGRHFVLRAHSYFVAFPLAFLIGIIFNLMPCVLPVLPLKAVGFYEVAQHNRARSLFLGTVFSIGLIAAFAVLALIVLVFHSITWGQQFSSPIFVTIIVIILLAFSAAQFGFFSILLPTKVYQFTPSHETITGNFLFGIFTAILSTPCTAPMFVGLLAWAAKQPPSLGVGSVMTVGLGMAAPYWLLSALPELARRMPRAGPWAELIKQLMGFLLLAVAVYFAAGKLIAGRQFIWAVFAVVAAASVFLVVRTSQIAKSRIAIVGAAVLALFLGGASLAISLRITGQSSSRELIQWVPYSSDIAQSATHTGKIVMVEFTANWCANCLTLEATVFHDPRAAAAIKKFDVLPLRADLSDQDAPGWKTLTSLNAAGGIPLTVIYPPGGAEPIQLSSIYTTQNLIDALDKASRSAVASAQ